MTLFPKGWFCIQCPSHHGHVLTVTPASYHTTRIELRPNTHQDHQLWTYDDGYLVNKHSGCGSDCLDVCVCCVCSTPFLPFSFDLVLAVRNEPRVKGQTLIQTERAPEDKVTGQHWEFTQQGVLKLAAYSHSVSAQDVPRMVEAPVTWECHPSKSTDSQGERRQMSIE
ncbi:hypothetical protein BDF14DRAFT_777109 [Spinellus fusiger]|nr:hypothetical protein BDF14DRAFT_777109 [Spinellus fusiger]